MGLALSDDLTEEGEIIAEGADVGGGAGVVAVAGNEGGCGLVSNSGNRGLMDGDACLLRGAWWWGGEDVERFGGFVDV